MAVLIVFPALPAMPYNTITKTAAAWGWWTGTQRQPSPGYRKKPATRKSYISNDILLNSGEQQIIITGPNMSGKAPYPSNGAYYPAGAHEVLFRHLPPGYRWPIKYLPVLVHPITSAAAKVHSWWRWIEASASSTLTQRSLILLDEIGRGTSTLRWYFNRLGIAEYLPWIVFQTQNTFLPRTIMNWTNWKINSAASGTSTSPIKK